MKATQAALPEDIAANYKKKQDKNYPAFFQGFMFFYSIPEKYFMNCTLS